MKKIIIIVSAVILAVGVILCGIGISKKKNDSGNSNIEESNVTNKEQEKEDSKIQKELIVDSVSIDGKTYKFGEITLNDFEKEGFHLDYDHKGYYIDEEKNAMYFGYDGEHPELQLTKEKYDVKWFIKPGSYNGLDYYLANDKYSGMVYHGELFDNQYCPMEIDIQNWSSNEEKNYKDCDVTSIEFGTTDDAWKNEEELLNRLKEYPDIKVKGIGLLSDEDDVIKALGEPKKRNSYYNKLMYNNDYQSVNIYLHDGKVSSIDISLSMNFYQE